MDQTAEADTPPATDEPHRREAIIARMRVAAGELQKRGLQVYAIPVGSDTAGCGGPVMQLAVTNPDALDRGRVLVTRELQTLTVKMTLQRWHPLRDDSAIQQLTDSIVYALSGPDRPTGKADSQ